MIFLNKPFAPHLTIYRAQESSISSILHRISAIIFLLIFFYICLIFMTYFNIFFYKYFISNKISYFLFTFCKFFFLKLSLFHIINGLKIIASSFNFLNNFSSLTSINKHVFLVFLIILFL